MACGADDRHRSDRARLGRSVPAEGTAQPAAERSREAHKEQWPATQWQALLREAPKKARRARPVRSAGRDPVGRYSRVNSRIGRTSMVPERAEGMRAAMAIASSTSRASTM